MSEKRALSEFDALLDLPPAERATALEQLAREAPQVATLVGAWIAAEVTRDPRLERDHYTPLVPATDDEVPDVADAKAGDRIGAFRLMHEIGRGGMGTVWLAERAEGDFAQAVALKLIRPDLASREAASRFRRERQILAGLKHPNVAQLVDGGVTPDGRLWLAMELVEGESLRTLLQRGPLAPKRLVALAAQVASGLAHAHAQGVVHRDLKPDNVLVAKEGWAKILDFGIAKLLTDDAPGTGDTGTQPGHVIGTTPYMSPEQASGQHVDFRSDQFALGALIYEAATGRAAFARPTPSQTVGAVLRDAPDLDALPASLPSAFVRILRRCLEKEPEERYGSTGDLARDLLDVERGVVTDTGHVRRTVASRRVVARSAGLFALVAVAAGAWWLGARTAPPAAVATARPVLRAELAIAPAERFWFGSFPLRAFALSPDGRRIVFAGVRDGERLLFARALDERVATAIPGSEGASNPVFSPDGEWIAFLGNQKVRRIPAAGGAAIDVADAPNALGGAHWHGDRILYSPSPSRGIWSVPADGGEPSEVTEPDVAAGEASHVWPTVVPGSGILIYVAEVEAADTFDAGRIHALDEATGRRTLLVDGGSDPHVVGDTLYYARSGIVYAAPLDRERLALAGSPKPLFEGVAWSSATGAAQYAIGDGVAIHLPGGAVADLMQPMVVDRTGAGEALALEPRVYDRARLSPDGTRLLMQVTGADDDLFVYDFARQALTRVTRAWENIAPAWMPDGVDIVYTHHRTPVPPPPTLYRRRADGSGEATLLLPPGGWLEARLYVDVAADGRTIAYSQYGRTNFDIWLLDVASGKARLWLQTPDADIMARFAPDGRHIAYVSAPTLTGTAQVFVQSLDGSRRWQITNDGGTQPVWSRDGRELFFMRTGAVWSVAIAAGDELAPGAPRKLFAGAYSSRFDVFPDGERFLMMRTVPEPGREGPLLIDAGPIGPGAP